MFNRQVVDNHIFSIYISPNAKKQSYMTIGGWDESALSENQGIDSDNNLKPKKLSMLNTRIGQSEWEVDFKSFTFFSKVHEPK